MELQEQIERMSREKEKVVKEKSVMKTEISELYAQIEILQSEKISIKKVVEKLEITVNEYHIKIEDLNRSVADMTSQKQKLMMEAQDSAKKLNEMKLAIEHAGMDKNKFASQLDELRRAADNEARNRNAAETKITSLERNIKTLTVEIEELRSIKISLEGSIEKWKSENADWKKKYETEARLRVEDVDALKKKFTSEVNGLTDMVHQLEQKLKAAENTKTKLSGEVNVLVKDFEHSQTVIKEITAKFQSSEKSCNDLSIKLKEMTNLYERQTRIARPVPMTSSNFPMKWTVSRWPTRLSPETEELSLMRSNLSRENLMLLRSAWATWTVRTANLPTSVKNSPVLTRMPMLASRRLLTVSLLLKRNCQR